MALLLAPGLAAAPSASASASGTTTISVWSYCGGAAMTPGSWGAAMETLVGDFEKANPSINVKLTQYSYNDYYTKIEATAAAGSGPDVTMQYFDAVDFWRDLLPLDNLITPAQKKTVSLTNISSVTVDTHNNKIDMMPWGLYEGVWAVNTGLLRHLGLSTAPPANFQNFLNLCTTVANKGVRPIAFAMGGPYDAWRFFAAYGGQLLNSSQLNLWREGKMPWTNPKIVAALKDEEAMQTAGCFGKKSWGVNSDTVDPGLFTAGKAVMTYPYESIPTGNVAGSWEKAVGGPSDLTAWELPPAPGDVWGGPTMDATDNNGFSIMKWSNQVPADWKFISWFVSPAGEAAGYQLMGQLPNNSAVTIHSSDPTVAKELEWAKTQELHYGAWNMNTAEANQFNRLAPTWLSGQIKLSAFTQQMQQFRQEQLNLSGG
jgi:ABC-type glycerol-3-phosphate transport system substrate-binding protein